MAVSTQKPGLSVWGIIENALWDVVKWLGCHLLPHSKESAVVTGGGGFLEWVTSGNWWTVFVAMAAVSVFVNQILRLRNNFDGRDQSDPEPKIDLLAGIKVPPLLPLPTGCNRLIPAQFPRADVNEEILQASHVWFASIAGAYLPHIRDEARKKIDRVLLVDPESAYIKSLASIQGDRGKKFPGNVKEAIELCKSENTQRIRDRRAVEVKLSSTPILNIVLFDPGTDRAWARVQEFIPYHLGQDTLVYVVRKEELKDLYEIIEDSFNQSWRDAEKPKGY